MISIVLSRPIKFMPASWLIMKFTNSDCSHASIHFSGVGGLFGEHSWVMEATAHGLSIVTSHIWSGVNEKRFAVSIDNRDLALSALSLLFRELGAEYDFSGVGRFALYLVLKSVSGRLANRVTRNTPDKMFCSEAVVRYIQIMDAISGDFPEVRKWNPDTIAPEDLKKLRFVDGFSLLFANA